MLKPPLPLRSKKYRKWIGQQICAVCKTNVGIDCAHVRMSDYALEKLNAMGMKPGDDWSIPLCRTHHDRQHELGEIEFYRIVGGNPLILAQQLRKCFLEDDYEGADRILRNWGFVGSWVSL